jgi:hypothetical protein
VSARKRPTRSESYRGAGALSSRTKTTWTRVCHLYLKPGADAFRWKLGLRGLAEGACELSFRRQPRGRVLEMARERL